MSNGTGPEVTPGAPGEPDLSKDDLKWALVSILCPLLQLVIPIPSVNVIAPLVIYFMKRDESSFVAFHALQSVYFQIISLVAGLVIAVLCFVLIGFVLAPIAFIGWIAYMAVIAIKASNGEWAEYWLVGEWARGSIKR